MKIRSILNRETITLVLLTICIIFLTFVVSGCGEEYHTSYDTGSYACSLKWPDDVPTLETTSRTARAIDCDAAGIATVAFDFYDGSGTYLTGDEWSCSLHQGTVHGIPAGTDRRLVVTGKDSSGTVLYRGKETGIEIVAGQTTEGGEIPMDRVPTVSSTSPANNGTGVAVNTPITATFSEAMDSSTITTTSFLVNDGTDNIAGTLAYSGTTATFTPTTTLDYETTYTATITTGAKDLAGNPLDADYTWSFTTTTRWTLLKLPDTGQTQSYTDTFGEDSDYTINPSSYTDNGDGTVTDNVTGLMWQQEDDDTERTWDEACSYCDDLTLAGYSDWRLPSKKELMSIVNYGTYNSSIDTTYFSGTDALFYWSSTTTAGPPSYAWGVEFYWGLVDNRYNSSSYYVRCVRAGQ